MVKQETVIKRKESSSVEKILFVFSVELYLIVDVVLVGLLKTAGQFQEFGSFPRGKNKLILLTNHPEGVEWMFIYYRLFRAIYLIKPWLILSELPYVLPDRWNFSHFLTRSLRLAIIPIDRERDEQVLKTHSRSVSLRRCIRILDTLPLIGFFEGSRTHNAVNKVYSQKKGKPLGKLNKSLGFLVKQTKADVGTGWVDFLGLSFHFLPLDGRFNLKRFIRWYQRTLFGKNGRIVLLWGEPKKAEELIARETAITDQIEEYMLELADRI